MALKNSEFPKQYSVPFIASDSVEDAILAIYALLETRAARPEITLISKKPSSIRDSLRYSINPVLMTVSRTNPVSYQEYKNEYMKHRAGITAVVSLDKKDKLRVGIALPPEDAAKKAGMDVTPVITIYDKATEDGMQGFFSEWENKFIELKKQQEES